MVAPKYLNRDELFAEQRGAEQKERAEQEAKLEEKMEQVFGSESGKPEMYDCYFELLEIRKD
jgi:hypothetical protein